MIITDWPAILREFEKSGQRPLFTGCSLLNFLTHSASSHLDEGILLLWLNERLARGGQLESNLVHLTHVDKLVAMLAARGLADRDLVQRLRKRPDLLEHLSGGRPQVPDSWRQLMATYENGLQGLAPLHQARCLVDAARFIEVIGQQGDPDEATLLCWLDQELHRCKIAKVMLSFARVERFCQFLQACGHPSNPARQWRRRYQGLEQALRCRKAGLDPAPRAARYQSFLAPHIEAYLLFKRGLGRKYLAVNYVDALGKFAQRQGVLEIGLIDRAMVLDFLSSRNWKSSTRGQVQGTLIGFFRFLTRSGLISVEKNPAKRLPRTRRPPRPPYIFSLLEIAAVLEELKKGPTQAFNQRLYSFMVLLIYSCGLRRGEALRLRVGDVDLENSVLFIRCTKFGKDRRIPIGLRVCDSLAQYHQGRVERLGPPATDAYFFVQATSAPVAPGSLRWQFQGACTRALVGSASRPRPRIHDLRHSFAVHRLNKWYIEGADLQSRLTLLSIYMGHISGESTRHYLHLSQDLLRLAARPMERSLECWLQDLFGELDES